MPGAEQFQSELRALGLADGGTVVCYDNAGLYSAARAWWMLRAMGFDRVAVLDGGLPAGAGAVSCWGRPAATQAGRPPSRTATRSKPMARSIHQARAAE
ncbi:sulfurtransferase [Streptacidiphilus pinicola]|uniref:sulfurtransferase n=1 Tax=Streptacidiphilus pinicola TaxID=2219663 RepID=UPI003C791964